MDLLKIEFLYTDYKGDNLYSIILPNGEEEVIEVCDGTVFPTTVLTTEQNKQVINHHFKEELC